MDRPVVSQNFALSVHIRKSIAHQRSFWERLRLMRPKTTRSARRGAQGTHRASPRAHGPSPSHNAPRRKPSQPQSHACPWPEPRKIPFLFLAHKHALHWICFQEQVQLQKDCVNWVLRLSLWTSTQNSSQIFRSMFWIGNTGVDILLAILI